MEKKIKELEAIIKNFEDTINQRIAHLNSVDADFCKDRWDMTKPENERNRFWVPGMQKCYYLASCKQ